MFSRSSIWVCRRCLCSFCLCASSAAAGLQPPPSTSTNAASLRLVGACGPSSSSSSSLLRALNTVKGFMPWTKPRVVVPTASETVDCISWKSPSRLPGTTCRMPRPLRCFDAAAAVEYSVCSLMPIERADAEAADSQSSPPSKVPLMLLMLPPKSLPCGEPARILCWPLSAWLASQHDRTIRYRSKSERRPKRPPTQNMIMMPPCDDLPSRSPVDCATMMRKLANACISAVAPKKKFSQWALYGNFLQMYTPTTRKSTTITTCRPTHAFRDVGSTASSTPRPNAVATSANRNHRCVPVYASNTIPQRSTKYVSPSVRRGVSPSLLVASGSDNMSTTSRSIRSASGLSVGIHIPRPSQPRYRTSGPGTKCAAKKRGEMRNAMKPHTPTV
eukprot:PhM_4_TR18082/c1_g1_i1/m.102112